MRTAAVRALVGLSSAALLYACTLDFGEYREGEATAGTGGASAGQGGANTSTGGTTQNGAGGSTGGNTASTGGAGGATAGVGGQATGCPATPPAQDEMCAALDLQCIYDGGATHCECWRGLFDCDTCPIAAPNDGDGCNGLNRERCFYDPIQCRCQQGVGWNCEECPAAEPDDGDNCNGLEGLHCTWGNKECSCGFGDWNC